MGTMLLDDIAIDKLDQLIERANLRLAWRLRFSDCLYGHLILAQRAHLQAKCLRVFGPRWEQEIAKEDGDLPILTKERQWLRKTPF